MDRRIIIITLVIITATIVVFTVILSKIQRTKNSRIQNLDLKPINVECEYVDSGNYDYILGSVYQCEVKNELNIKSQESAEIGAISGKHAFGKTNDDLIGLRAEYNVIQYFPQNLASFFKNLKIIDFYHSQLREIHQSDVKPFADLTVIYLGYNSIQIIEKGLFDFNPKLQVVAFENNPITHIDPDVFDHLENLRSFRFNGVTCVERHVLDSVDDVKQALNWLKTQCR